MSSHIERRQSLHRQVEDNERHIADLERQLQSLQKLSAIGTTACMAAHEFNNILLTIINYSEQALKRQDDPEFVQKALEKTVQHSNHATAIINGMLDLASKDSVEPKPVQLASLVQECFHCLGRDFSKDKITVKVNIDRNLSVLTVPGELQQVLLNLIINARQAMRERGGILTVEAIDRKDGSTQIKVTDTGCGIKADNLEKIFEPFYTTKTDASLPDQRGTGLGLAVCRNIIESNSGSISVSSESGRGTTFIISLGHCRSQTRENQKVSAAQCE